MKKYCIIADFILIALSAVGQVDLQLSNKHQVKLASISSGHKRIVKFHKYFKRDSARYFRLQNKKYKKALDSTWRKPNIEVKQVDVNDSLFTEINRYWLLSNDSLVADTVKMLAREKLKFLVLARANQYPGFQQLKDRYQLAGDSLTWEAVTKQVQGLDTLSNLFSNSPEELFQLSEKLVEKRL